MKDITAGAPANRAEVLYEVKFNAVELDLLYELTDRATKPEFVYTHKWSVGDVVMLDNRVTMHRVLRHYPEDAPRDLRRTSVEDIAPTLEQVA